MSTVDVMPAGSDIFASYVDALVSPVDTTGAQGKGLALAIARRFKYEAAAYKAECHGWAMRPGGVWVAPRLSTSKPWIVFLATKDHWRNLSRLEWIDTGLINLRHALTPLGIRHVAVPALGCGQGGLAWEDVGPRLIKWGEEMAEARIRVLIYPPGPSATAASHKGIR